MYQKTPFAHVKNVYAKMQAIIDPNKIIEYAELPNYYPRMLLEVKIQSKSAQLEQMKIKYIAISDGTTMSKT